MFRYLTTNKHEWRHFSSCSCSRTDLITAERLRTAQLTKHRVTKLMSNWHVCVRLVILFYETTAYGRLRTFARMRKMLAQQQLLQYVGCWCCKTVVCSCCLKAWCDKNDPGRSIKSTLAVRRPCNAKVVWRGVRGWQGFCLYLNVFTSTWCYPEARYENCELNDHIAWSATASACTGDITVLWRTVCIDSQTVGTVTNSLVLLTTAWNQ